MRIGFASSCETFAPASACLPLEADAIRIPYVLPELTISVCSTLLPRTSHHCKMALALILFCAAMAGMSGFLFGYDSGIMTTTIAQEQFLLKFSPSSAIIGTIVSIMQAGGFFGCLSAGKLSDLWGRKRATMFGCVFILVCQTSSLSLVFLRQTCKHIDWRCSPSRSSPCRYAHHRAVYYRLRGGIFGHNGTRISGTSL